MRVKCHAQELNRMTRSGLKPGPVDPESSLLITMPTRLPHEKNAVASLKGGHIWKYQSTEVMYFRIFFKSIHQCF